MKEELQQFSNEQLKDLILVVLEVDDSYRGKKDWMMDNEHLYEEIFTMMDLMEVEE